jgi:phosphoserine phosphatase
MAANGAYCALVSGGFTFFTDRIAKLTGFHTTQANKLEIKESKLTGQVIPPILGSAAKKQALETYLREKGLSPDESLAVGDGANDLEMIRIAGLGVAYRAKPIVAAEAKAAVNHTSLTSLLYFQGYKKSEFVT